MGTGGVPGHRVDPAQASTRTVAFLAMAFSIAIELSQLYHAPWIDSIRQTTLGGLILGLAFCGAIWLATLLELDSASSLRCGSQVDAAPETSTEPR